MSSPLKILFVTAEMTPLLSTGGLAEVANALPKALHAQGHDVRVAMPCWRQIPPAQRGEHYALCVADLGARTAHGALRQAKVPDSEIPLYLVEHEGYYGREHPYGTGVAEYEDNAERFCFFSLALLHALPQTSWQPDVIHCHDWHAAPLPAFLKTQYQNDPVWGRIPVVFTIHNLGYQGQYRASNFYTTGFDSSLFTPEFLEYHGDINLMKGGIAFADRINTVSPRYAREIQTPEYGHGLDGVLRTRQSDLSGILNAVDYSVWNPVVDKSLPAQYSADDMAGKAACKAALQERLGLPRRDVPLVGLVSRLHWQKGIDLLVDALDELMKEDLQLVILGAGEAALEDGLQAVEARHPERLAVRLEFAPELAHAIFAGADFLLMPSRYEPCGLGQLYAMAYGTLPIVRRTGGLADTVTHANSVNLAAGKANGIVFVPRTSGAVLRAVREAMTLYRQPRPLAQVRRTAMQARFSWERAAKAYVALFADAMNGA